MAESCEWCGWVERSANAAGVFETLSPLSAAENGKIHDMQGLILAAGMGKRLKELTQDNTHCIVKVNGVRLIERALDRIFGLGLMVVA